MTITLSPGFTSAFTFRTISGAVELPSIRVMSGEQCVTLYRASVVRANFDVDTDNPAFAHCLEKTGVENQRAAMRHAGSR